MLIIGWLANRCRMHAKSVGPPNSPPLKVRPLDFALLLLQSRVFSFNSSFQVDIIMGAVEILTIESKDQLKEAVARTPIFVLFCTVEGRDAVNASAQEEFER